jgi:endoglucanase
MPFTIRRGTNVSHWLSQSNKRGEERLHYFTRADCERIAELGFDHVRIPVDEEQLWAEDGSPEAEAFDLLDAALDWARECGLRAVVDLHILRSHHFNEKDRPLFTDSTAQQRFLQCWRDLSGRLKRRPVDRVAYELLNEAVAENAEDWNRIAGRAVATLRGLEPERLIVLGSNLWNSVDTYDVLDVPEDERLILTFHFYTPMFLTHYRASWTKCGEYEGPVHYPGRGIPEDKLEGMDPELKGSLVGGGNFFCRAVMADLLEKPLAVRERTGLPLYCGEWGCIHKSPRADRLRWYADMRAVLEERGIAWATWDWKGGFGLVKGDGSGEVDEEMARVLLG